MFLTSGIVAVFLGLKFAAGFIIGAGTAKLIYWSSLTKGRILRAALGAGVMFLFVSGLAGWAGSHAAFENDRRLDFAPWGEDLRLRNAIAANEVLLCLISSIGIAVLANVSLKDKNL